MLRKIFILFRIGRRLAMSDAVDIISKIHQPPLIIKLFIKVFSFSFSKEKDLSDIKSDEDKLCESIQGMGTTFIKLGQFLATRPDIIGEEISKKLEKLQDRLPPFAMQEAKNILKESLGIENFNSILKSYINFLALSKYYDSLKYEADPITAEATFWEQLANSNINLQTFAKNPKATKYLSRLQIELNDGEFFRVQVKGTSQTKERYNFNFRRGFHGSKDGMFDYSPTDFDISCCVSLTDEAALFSAGVERSISWTRAQFNQPRAAILSFEESIDAVRRKRREAET